MVRGALELAGRVSTGSAQGLSGSSPSSQCPVALAATLLLCAWFLSPESGKSSALLPPTVAGRLPQSGWWPVVSTQDWGLLLSPDRPEGPEPGHRDVARVMRAVGV